jgi:hypothetical protein
MPYGPYIEAHCQRGECVSEVLNDQCVGPVLDGLYLPTPPVKVGIDGGIGTREA